MTLQNLTIKALLRHSKTLWNSPFVTEEVNRHNRRAWVRSVALLGDKWLLAKRVQRVQ